MSDYYVDASVSPNPVWVQSTAYTANKIVCPVQDGGADNKYVYEADADGGTSGVTEPAWPTTPGNTVVDNDITWTCRAPDSWGEALCGIQGALDLAVAGDTVYCRGTETVATARTVDTNNGSATTGWVRFVGVNNSGNNDGTYYVLDGGTTSTNCLTFGNIDYVYFENFEIKRASGDGVQGNTSTAYPVTFYNCSFHDNGGYGVAAMSNRLIGSAIRCKAYNNTTGGFRAETLNLLFCSATDNGLGVYCGGYSPNIACCLFYGNTNKEIESTSGGFYLFNTINGGSTGLSSATAQTGAVVVSNRFTNLTTGLDANSRGLFYGWNYYDTNTNDTANTTYLYEFLDAGSTTNLIDQGDTNQGYTSLTDGSENLALNSTATLRRTAVQIPTESSTAHNFYIAAGMVPNDPAGGIVTHSGMTGGLNG